MNDKNERNIIENEETKKIKKLSAGKKVGGKLIGSWQKESKREIGEYPVG